jgi:hypothetical protein
LQPKIQLRERNRFADQCIEASGVRASGAIHAFPPPPSELFIVIRRERKAAREAALSGADF